MNKSVYINKDIERCHGIAKASYVAVLNYYKNRGLPYFHLFPDFHSIVADAAIEIYKTSKLEHPLSNNDRLLFLCGFNQIRNDTLIDKYYGDRKKWIPINKRFNDNAILFVQDIQNCTKDFFGRSEIDAWEFSVSLEPNNLKEDYQAKIVKPITSLLSRKIFRENEFSKLFYLTEESPSLPFGHMILFLFHSRNYSGRRYTSTKSIKDWGADKSILVRRRRFHSIDDLIEKGPFYLSAREDVCFLNDIQMHAIKTMNYSHGLKAATVRLKTKPESYIDNINPKKYNKEELNQTNEYKFPTTLCETTAFIINSKLEGLRLIKKDNFEKIKKRS
ncbi:MAG: hypothetical protein ACRCVT_15305 [Leadbetterella sp.]